MQLLPGTVAENITRYQPGAQQDLLFAAARNAGAFEMITQLPQGFDTDVRQLSGGMKRRLMVAKAMVHSPPILILDEPTAGVDVELRRSLWEYVRKLNGQGVTIVLTTHYLEEAQEMCDEIAIINHGQVIACEPTHKLLRRLNHKTLVVRTEQGLNTVPEALADLSPTIRKDGQLAITYRIGEQSIEGLLTRLRDAKVGISDLATEEPDLEDVFVSLTSA